VARIFYWILQSYRQILPETLASMAYDKASHSSIMISTASWIGSYHCCIRRRRSDSPSTKVMRRNTSRRVSLGRIDSGHYYAKLGRAAMCQ